MTQETALADTAAEQTAAEPVGYALVAGQRLKELPQDLYIPPDALEVFLETFEGPLDLLLYLIRRQNMDILEINVSQITQQYMTYIELMASMRFELAAEYLLMAATLAEIKSRMLLPRQAQQEDEEEDPRAELIRRLQQYEQFRHAAESLDELPRLERDAFLAQVPAPDLPSQRLHPAVDLHEVLLALRDLLRRADLFTQHEVSKERLSTRERMAMILDRLNGAGFVAFESLFTLQEGRLGLVVSFIAILELVKEQLIELVQTNVFGSIHIRARLTC